MMVHPLLFILLSYTVADPLLFELYNRNASNYDPWKIYAGSYGFNNSVQGVRFPANRLHLSESSSYLPLDVSVIKLRSKGIVYSGSGKSEHADTYATLEWMIVDSNLDAHCELKFPGNVKDAVIVTLFWGFEKAQSWNFVNPSISEQKPIDVEFEMNLDKVIVRLYFHDSVEEISDNRIGLNNFTNQKTEIYLEFKNVGSIPEETELCVFGFQSEQALYFAESLLCLKNAYCGVHGLCLKNPIFVSNSTQPSHRSEGYFE
jgi:hypothetical protein